MKKLSFAALFFVTILALPAWAETPDAKPPFSLTVRTPGETTAKVEAKSYQPYQQQCQDARALVQQRAEFRANQRLYRVTSMQWYGLSNSRPRVNPDLLDDDYAPQSVSNNPAYPQRWQASRTAVVVVPSTVTR
jgi:hypothetical protein